MRPRPALLPSAWILAVLAGCGAAEGQGPPEGSAPRPNVVLILVDDLGWTDVACYGSRAYRTPRIDELARRGVRLTNAYASNPMCKASRYALMTGRYAARKRSNAPDPGAEPVDETTVAEVFRDEGYATFFAGKWHIEKRRSTPRTYGFDTQVGVHKKGEPATYFFPYGEEGDPKKVPLEEGGEPGEYLTDRLTDEALAFIDAHAEQPFFVCLSHYAVHKPLEAKAELVAAYERILADTDHEGPAVVRVGKALQKQRQDDPVYAAMVHSVDESVGRVLDALDEHDLTDRTIVLFTSDNGGDSCNTTAGERSSTSNVPLKAGKFWLYEGGIRVPLVVAYPPTVSAGGTADAVVTGTDHYPTLLELAGLEPRPRDHVDGVSYAPVLRAEADWTRPAAFWHFPIDGSLAAWVGTEPGSAIREGDYKLIEWYESGTIELYDLADDVGEERDLGSAEPERARALLDRLRRWRAEVDAPL